MPAKGTQKDWMELIGAKESIEEDIAIEKLGGQPKEHIKEANVKTEEAINAAKNSLNFLAALAMPTVFQFKFPPILLTVWSLLQKLVFLKHDFSQIALGIPRGHGKTTLIKLFVLFIILFTDRKFILIVSSTASLAENILADISDFLNEPNIKKVFGDWKAGVELDRQELKKFGFRGRNIIIAAIGAGGSIRGLNLKNERPDTMIFEDIQTKECSESPIQSQALERWMVGTAMKAKSPHGCLMIFCGNMFPGPNSILKKLKDNPNWISFTTGAILSDGTALWEELRPMKDLLDELDNDIAMGHAEVFFSEVLNDTDVSINSRIDLSTLGEWKWNEFDNPSCKFLVIDPSVGKVGRDATAISRCEVYDTIPCLREVIEEILSPKATIMTCILLCLKHNIHLIAIESTAYQATLSYWFQQEMDRLHITGIQAVPIHSTSASKNSRIQQALKGLGAKEIILHPSVRSQVIHQAANWNPMKRDNVDGILDTITYIPQVIEKYSHLIMSEETVISIEANSAVVHEHEYMF